MLPFDQVNLIAVLAAFALNMVLGMIWYSPSVFGATWLQLSKLADQSAMKTMQQAFIIGSFATLLMVYVLALLLAILDPISLSEALMDGVLLWLGLVVVTKLNSVAWAGRSWTLFAIDTGHALASILLTVAILTQWPW